MQEHHGLIVLIQSQSLLTSECYLQRYSIGE